MRVRDERGALLPRKIAQSSDGRTALFSETTFKLRRGGFGVRWIRETKLLAVDLDAGVVQRFNAGEFTPSLDLSPDISGNPTPLPPGVITRDGGKL